MKRRVTALALTVVLLMQVLSAAGLADGMQFVSGAVGNTYYTATFTDQDGTALGTQYVRAGSRPVEPDAPQVYRSDFMGWSPSLETPVTADTVYVPTYSEITTKTVTIRYLKNDGSEICAPVIRSYASTEEFSETFASPLLTSWVADLKSVSYTHEDLTAAETEYVVTYVPADKEYTVYHHFEELDGTYTHNPELNHTRSSVIGEIVQADALTEKPTGFHFDYYGSQAVIKEDEDAVVHAYYSRDINSVVYDSFGGEPIEAVTGRYESLITLPLPVRTGYTFQGWYTSTEYADDQFVGMDGDSVAITADPQMTYYARWNAEGVPYTIVYMIECENLGHEADISRASDFYTSHITFTRNAPTGTTVTATDEDINYAGFTAKVLHGETYKPNVMAAVYLGSDEVVVKGDGSSVLRVYYKRVRYTFAFDLQNAVHEYGDGEEDYRVRPCWFRYNGSSEYLDSIVIRDVCYGDDISTRWPSEATGSFYWKDENGNFIPADFAGWEYTRNSMLTRSHRLKVEGYVFDAYNTDGTTDKKFICVIIEAEFPTHINYWVPEIVIPAEAPRNTTGEPIIESVTDYAGIGYSGSTMEDYWLHPATRFSVMANGINTRHASIGGFATDVVKTNTVYKQYLYSTAGNQSRYRSSEAHSLKDEEGHNVYQFLYTRNSYKLNYISLLGDYALPSYTVPFEAKLSWFEPTELVVGESTERDENGIVHYFSGWYYDPKYEQPVNWETDLMPFRGTSLYAKWEPQTIDITFDLNYEGAPEPVTYTFVVGSYMQDQPDFEENPVRRTYEFFGWFMTPDAAEGTGFPIDQAVAESLDGTTVYASWKSKLTDYTVCYVDAATGAALLTPKLVRGKQIGLEPTELFVNIPGLRPDKLEETIMLDEDPAKNRITFYYAERTEVEYQVIHRYTDENGTVVEIPEDPQTTTDERVVVYSGHEEIPEGYYAVVTAKSRVLTSDPESNRIYLDYLPYRTATFVVYHHYQTDLEAQTEYTDYPVDASKTEEAVVRKGYSWIAERRPTDTHRLTGIYVEETQKNTGSDVYLTAEESDLGEVTEVHMYYALKYAPGLSVRKTSDVPANTRVEQGDVIVYTITVTNTGNCPLTNVVLTDGMLNESWTIAVLEAGESETFRARYTVTYADAVNGRVYNSVTAEADDVIDPTDPENPIAVESDEDDVTDYTVRRNTVTVNYWFGEIGGESAAETFEKVYEYGDSYRVVSPKIPGYTVDVSVVEGTVGGDVEYNVIYTPETLKLEIQYIYEDGTAAAPSHTEELHRGEEYSVTSPELEGYIPSISVVEGSMPGHDVTVTVIYINILGPEETPGEGGDAPGKGGRGGRKTLITIEEYLVPLSIGSVELNVGDCFE